MKTIIFLFIGCLSLSSLYGQTLERDVVSNGGDDFQHAGISMSWTLGEIVTQTIGNSPILTQGFQQPDSTYFDSTTIESPANYWIWANKVDDLSAHTHDSGNEIAINYEGDIILVGNHGTNYTSSDIFLAKIRPNGEKIWSKRIGSYLNGVQRGIYNENGEGVTVDSLGNIYVIGRFNYNTFIGNQIFYAAGTNDIIFLKFNTHGELQWVKQLGASSSGRGKGIALDNDRNIFLTGDFVGTISIDSHSITSKPGYWSSFVAKFDSIGNVKWLHTAIPDIGHNFVSNIVVDYQGNCYVTGDFGSGIVLNDSITISNPLFFKLDSSGNLIWIENIGDDLISIHGNDIALDKSNNIYITGLFNGTATFGNTTLFSEQGSDIFTVKYASNRNVKWVKQLGRSINDSGNGIALDQLGNCYITGNMLKTFSYPPYNNQEIFIAKYDMNGYLEWIEETGTTNYEEYSKAIVIDNFGNSYITGSFKSQTYFGDTIILTGYRDIFYAKYGNVPYVNTSNSRVAYFESFGDENSDNNETTIKIYPNPVITDKLSFELIGYEGGLIYSIINTSGLVVKKGIFNDFSNSKSISVIGLSKGFYILKIHIPSGNQSQKFMLR